MFFEIISKKIRTLENRKPVPSRVSSAKNKQRPQKNEEKNKKFLALVAKIRVGETIPEVHR